MRPLLALGTEVGGYRIEGVLGRGGMGVVYEATQLSLGRSVALKVIAGDVGSDESFRERFRREGRIQAGLDHPHIVPVFAAGELDEQWLFIAMPIVRGPNLKQLIRAGDVAPARALAILAPVADALDAAHEARLVHRDIKPQNILVGRRDHPYLSDFGLTRAPGDTAFTKTGHFVGTLDYIAPEQIQGEPPVSSGDIYSLAAVAFECLTGSVPFPKPTEAAILFAHMSEPPPRASSVRPSLGAATDDVLMRGLAKDAADRPATASELIAQLHAAVAADAALAAPPATPVVAPDDAGESTQPVAVPDPQPSGTPRRATAPTVTAGSPTPPAPAPPSRTATVAVSAPAEVEEGPGQETLEASPHGVPTRPDRRRDPEITPAAPPATPPREPADRREEESRRSPFARRRLIAVGAVAAVAIAGAAGVLTAPDAQPPPPAQQLTSGSLRLTAPEGWRAGNARAPEALRLSSPATAVDGSRSTMTVGMSGATGRYLLPRDFLERLPQPPPAGARVRLSGDVEALRYEDLQPKGATAPMTVLAAPTTDGVATVVCTGTAAARRACEGAATTLRLTGGHGPIPAGPRDEYANALGAVVRRLQQRRGAALKTWRSARTRRGQGSAAAAMAAAFDQARRGLRQAPVAPLEAEAHAAMVTALEDASRHYGKAASAARAGKAGRYRRARDAAVRAEGDFREALRSTRELGYEVG